MVLVPWVWHIPHPMGNTMGSNTTGNNITDSAGTTIIIIIVTITGTTTTIVVITVTITLNCQYGPHRVRMVSLRDLTLISLLWPILDEQVAVIAMVAIVEAEGVETVVEADETDLMIDTPDATMIVHPLVQMTNVLMLAIPHQRLLYPMTSFLDGKVVCNSHVTLIIFEIWV